MRRGLEDGRHDPFGIEGRLRFDREAFVPTQDEASPLCAALLEDDREQRAQKLVEDDLARDGLRRFGHRVEVELLGPHRDGGAWARGVLDSTSWGYCRSSCLTLPSAPQRA